MKTNYHTHTYRCNHAEGLDRDYIEKAIEKGIKIIAFTEHMPDKKIGFQYRLSEETLEEYLESFHKYKEEYKNDIEILVGLECEYFEDNIEQYEKYKRDKLIELMILGHHFLPNRKTHMFDVKEKEQVVIYTKTICQAINSNYFDIIAHPDMFCSYYPKWDSFCDMAAETICRVAKEKNIPLEINSQGIRSAIRSRSYNNSYYKRKESGYCYPVKEFWEYAKIHNNLVVISGDYHSPCDIEDDCIILAREFAKELDLNVIDSLGHRKF